MKKVTRRQEKIGIIERTYWEEKAKKNTDENVKTRKVLKLKTG